jgi:hypothetical protein
LFCSWLHKQVGLAAFTAVQQATSGLGGYAPCTVLMQEENALKLHCAFTASNAKQLRSNKTTRPNAAPVNFALNMMFLNLSTTKNSKIERKKETEHSVHTSNRSLVYVGFLGACKCFEKHLVMVMKLGVVHD